jgi:hypothetical protein
MLKVLLLFPLFALACVIGASLVLPLLALVPVLLVVFLAVALPLLLLRVLLGLALSIGGLIIGALGIGFAIAGAALFLVLGFALAHLLLPVLIIVGLIWLIRRASRTGSPARMEHHPG